MYHLIETKYVGPNEDEHVDANTIDISTQPARTNSSHEVRTDGWCGTNGDWATYAHGEYPTLEAAQAALGQTFGPVRGRDPESGDAFDISPLEADGGVVERYKPGRYAPMSKEDTEQWAYDAIKNDVTPDISEARIQELIREYEADCNQNGYSLNESFLEEIMLKERDEQKYWDPEMIGVFDAIEAQNQADLLDKIDPGLSGKADRSPTL